jgi:hypothetical protein
MITIRGSFDQTRECVTGFDFETNGFQGGDAGHGGYLAVTIKDLDGCTMFEVNESTDESANHGVTITFRGDAEIHNAIDGLFDLAKALRGLLKKGALE